MFRVLLLVGLQVLNVIAQTPAKFTITGNMTTPRSGHTATLLKDGRVLITGGYDFNLLGANVVLSSAELYDPSTGAFTRTGNMTTPRSGHTATLLRDGRALIVGGTDNTSSEIYDPATGVFTRAADLTSKHNFHAANLLSNGKVLITGWPMAELYDPGSDIFTPIGQVNNWGSNSTAVLPDGGVLIPGNDNVSLYDLSSNSIQLVTSLAGGYAYHTATLLANGEVLIAGGEGDAYDRTLNEASLYDPRNRTMGGTGLLLFSRDGHTATLLPGGHVLIVGGYDGDGYDTGVPTLKDAEDYDPSTGSFTFAGSLTYLREGHTATLLPDGRVLIAGGSTGNPIAELYIPPLRVASAARLSEPLAPASLASLFGSSLATTTETGYALSPDVTLGGVNLRITDNSGGERFAPLLYVSPSQINFEVPAGTALGKIAVEVDNAAKEISQTVAQVDNIEPGLFIYPDDTVIAYALRLEPDGKQTLLSVRTTIILDDRPVYLIAYATGIRNRSSLANVRCTIGGISVPVEYAGPEGSGIPGLDQINLRLVPALKGLGVATFVVTVDGVTSNRVSVDVR